MAAFKKIKISPESVNYCDNAENVAYLYRGYYVWKAGESGLFDAWNFAPAVYHIPKADETFEPYWDDNGDTKSAPTRSSCIKVIDRLHEQGLAVINPGYDPDAEKNVTLTVSRNEARTILAALSRRVSDLESLGGPEAESLAAEARNAYQSIDQQTFHPCS